MPPGRAAWTVLPGCAAWPCRRAVSGRVRPCRLAVGPWCFHIKGTFFLASIETYRGSNFHLVLTMAPISTSTAIGAVVSGSLLAALGVLFFAYSVFWRWKRLEAPVHPAAPGSSPTPLPLEPSILFTKTLPTLPPLIYEMPTQEDKRYELPTPANTGPWRPSWI